MSRKSHHELSESLRLLMIETPDFSDPRSMLNCLDNLIHEFNQVPESASSSQTLVVDSTANWDAGLSELVASERSSIKAAEVWKKTKDLQKQCSHYDAEITRLSEMVEDAEKENYELHNVIHQQSKAVSLLYDIQTRVDSLEAIQFTKGINSGTRTDHRDIQP
uniref:Uncharacterized protein n=1 Tax=Fibrocapsa japonica TaxID=94617 RepID=A0A7S2V6L4_9STRA